MPNALRTEFEFSCVVKARYKHRPLKSNNSNGSNNETAIQKFREFQQLSNIFQ